MIRFTSRAVKRGPDPSTGSSEVDASDQTFHAPGQCPLVPRQGSGSAYTCRISGTTPWAKRTRRLRVPEIRLTGLEGVPVRLTSAPCVWRDEAGLDPRDARFGEELLDRQLGALDSPSPK